MPEFKFSCPRCGRRPTGDGIHSFSGLVDEQAIFNRALSASEIKAIYAGQK